MPHSAEAFLRRFGPAALVTGASNGIGRAIAALLASYGLDLVLVARNKTALGEIAADLSARHGIGVTIIPADLAEPGAVDAVLGHPATERVGLLVAAAGFGSAGRFDQLPLADELAMVDVNCRATVALAHGIAPRLVTRGQGGMILFASLVGWQGTPFAATYAATKAFVQSFGEALHRELRPAGVDVLVAAPGPVATGFGDRAGMALTMTDTADIVAADILRVLGKRGQIAPGRVGRLLTLALWPVPRRLRIGIMGRIMKRMAQGKEGAR